MPKGNHGDYVRNRIKIKSMVWEEAGDMNPTDVITKLFLYRLLYILSHVLSLKIMSSTRIIITRTKIFVGKHCLFNHIKKKRHDTISRTISVKHRTRNCKLIYNLRLVIVITVDSASCKLSSGSRVCNNR